MYQYKMKSTGHSSNKYGNCEVCDKHATEVFYQTEKRKCSGGWTRYMCRDLYGHKECLIKTRREPHESNIKRGSWRNAEIN